MAHRTFRDGVGLNWEVWDIVPGSLARRRIDRRSDEERRGQGDRRTDYASAIGVREELSAGWLCFLSETEKRRLAPIPAGWQQLGDDALRELLVAAKPAAAQPLLTR